MEFQFLLGMIIGFSIAGQIFYIMTLHNLSYYALIKALGGTETMILKMILFQAVVVGIIGYIIGNGGDLALGISIKNTTLTFEYPWQSTTFYRIFCRANMRIYCSFKH